MTSMDLLEIMGDVDEYYVLEAHRKVGYQRKPVPFKRRLLMVALVAAMLLLVGCAVVLMRMQGLKVGDYSYTYPEWAGEQAGQTVTGELISMQGFTGSKNYQAAKEWNDFLENYDTDGVLLKAAKTDDYQENEAYVAYTCYTQEMQDEIDEICEKYDLEILGPVYMEYYAIDAIKAVGIETIFADTVSVPSSIYDGYYYGGGTFQLSGETTLNYDDSPWIYPITYQYRRVMKNAFDTVCLSVGNIEDYEEWNYTLQDGTEVLLALSSEQALILVDKDEYFVTVNVLETRVGDILYGEQQMTREGLEAFAETFTFK